jgi:hypothetical protein
VLADALGVTRDTVDNWIEGSVEPKGRYLLELMAFFDEAFAREVSGGIVTKLPNREAAAALERRAAADRDFLAAMQLRR